MTLKKFLILTLIVAVPALALVAINARIHLVKARADVPNGSQTFTTLLSGSQEVPAITTSASGDALFKSNDDQSVISYTLRVVDAQAVTMAHIHCGAPGQNGPVIVPLLSFLPGRDMDGDFVTGTINTDDIQAAGANCNPKITTVAELVQAMQNGQVYANVHSEKNPNGEIRGQIMLATSTVQTETATSTATTTQPRTSVSEEPIASPRVVTESTPEQPSKSVVTPTPAPTPTSTNKPLPGHYFVFVTADSYYKIEGSTVSFSGSHFYPNEVVMITSGGSTIGSVTADATGTFSTGLYAVPYISGLKTYRFTGVVSNRPFDVDIKVGKSNPWITLSTYYAGAGAPIVISGHSFGSNEPVSVTFNGVSLGSVTTNTNGEFSLSTTVPGGVGGDKAVEAVGNDTGAHVTQRFSQAY
jgi:hypothetical protein